MQPGPITLLQPVQPLSTAYKTDGACNPLFSMEPIVIALASNERYFPGLYCSVASALSHLEPIRKVDLKVLDGGVSDKSRKVLSDLVGRSGRTIQLEFVPIDESIFRGATLGPGRSHMTYCRILLPHLLDVPRLIYLDCDVLVFRDLSQLFDFELARGKALIREPEIIFLSPGFAACPTPQAGPVLEFGKGGGDGDGGRRFGGCGGR